MTLKKSRLDYKWVILVICFLMEFLCLGFCSSNVGLYTKSVTEALGIPRSLYSLSTSIRYIVQVIVALHFGTLVNRFGIRKMTGVGLVSLTGSVVVRAFATQLYHLYIGGAMWGLGIVFVGSNMASTIVRRWFHQDVGRYTGLVMSANGVGGAIAAQIISPLINNGETFGYRKAYLLSALVSFVISVVVILCLREHPAGTDPEPVTKKKKQPRGALWEGIPYETLKRRPYFYAVAALVFLTGITLQSIGSITIVFMEDLGMSAGFIANYATVSALCMTFSKILVGIVYDRRGLRVMLLICQLSAVITFLIKAMLTNSAAGMVLAMITAVLSAVATAMDTVAVPLLVNDLFGSVSYSKVLGILMAMTSLGLCLGSPLGNLYFDLYGTYRPCFWFFTLLMIVVIVGYRWAIRLAYRDKQVVLDRSAC